LCYAWPMIEGQSAKRELEDIALAARITAVMPVGERAGDAAASLETLLRGARALSMVAVRIHAPAEDAASRALAASWPNAEHFPGEAGSAEALALAEADAPPGRDVLVLCEPGLLYPDGFLLAAARRLIETGADALVHPVHAEADPGAGCLAKAVQMAGGTGLSPSSARQRQGLPSGWVANGRASVFRAGKTGPALDGASGAVRLWHEATLSPSRRIRHAGPGAIWQRARRAGRERGEAVFGGKSKAGLGEAVTLMHLPLLLLGAVSLPGRSYLLLYASGLAGAGLMLAVRHRTFCGLAASAVLALQHLGASAGLWQGAIGSARRRRR